MDTNFRSRRNSSKPNRKRAGTIDTVCSDDFYQYQQSKFSLPKPCFHLLEISCDLYHEANLYIVVSSRHASIVPGPNRLNEGAWEEMGKTVTVHRQRENSLHTKFPNTRIYLPFHFSLRQEVRFQLFDEFELAVYEGHLLGEVHTTIGRCLLHGTSGFSLPVHNGRDNIGTITIKTEESILYEDETIGEVPDDDTGGLDLASVSDGGTNLYNVPSWFNSSVLRFEHWVQQENEVHITRKECVRFVITAEKLRTSMFRRHGTIRPYIAIRRKNKYHWGSTMHTKVLITDHVAAGKKKASFEFTADVDRLDGSNLLVFKSKKKKSKAKEESQKNPFAQKQKVSEKKKRTNARFPLSAQKKSEEKGVESTVLIQVWHRSTSGGHDTFIGANQLDLRPLVHKNSVISEELHLYQKEPHHIKHGMLNDIATKVKHVGDSSSDEEMSEKSRGKLYVKCVRDMRDNEEKIRFEKNSKILHNMYKAYVQRTLTSEMADLVEAAKQENERRKKAIKLFETVYGKIEFMTTIYIDLSHNNLTYNPRSRIAQSKKKNAIDNLHASNELNPYMNFTKAFLEIMQEYATSIHQTKIFSFGAEKDEVLTPNSATSKTKKKELAELLYHQNAMATHLVDKAHGKVTEHTITRKRVQNRHLLAKLSDKDVHGDVAKNGAATALLNSMANSRLDSSEEGAKPRKRNSWVPVEQSFANVFFEQNPTIPDPPQTKKPESPRGDRSSSGSQYFDESYHKLVDEMFISSSSSSEGEDSSDSGSSSSASKGSTGTSSSSSESDSLMDKKHGSSRKRRIIRPKKTPTNLFEDILMETDDWLAEQQKKFSVLHTFVTKVERVQDWMFAKKQPPTEHSSDKENQMKKKRSSRRRTSKSFSKATERRSDKQKTKRVTKGKSDGVIGRSRKRDKVSRKKSSANSNPSFVAHLVHSKQEDGEPAEDVRFFPHPLNTVTKQPIVDGVQGFLSAYTNIWKTYRPGPACIPVVRASHHEKFGERFNHLLHHEEYIPTPKLASEPSFRKIDVGDKLPPMSDEDTLPTLVDLLHHIYRQHAINPVKYSIIMVETATDFFVDESKVIEFLAEIESVPCTIIFVGMLGMGEQFTYLRAGLKKIKKDDHIGNYKLHFMVFYSIQHFQLIAQVGLPLNVEKSREVLIGWDFSDEDVDRILEHIGVSPNKTVLNEGVKCEDFLREVCSILLDRSLHIALQFVRDDLLYFFDHPSLSEKFLKQSSMRHHNIHLFHF